MTHWNAFLFASVIVSSISSSPLGSVAERLVIFAARGGVENVSSVRLQGGSLNH